MFRGVLQDPEVLSPSTESLLRGPKRSFNMHYLRTQTQHATLLDAYIAFAKRPPTPGRMRAVIGAAGLASSQAGFGEKIGDGG